MDKNIPNCEKCNTPMQPHYENNGFEPPEGAPHYEISFFSCPDCVPETTIIQITAVVTEEELKNEKVMTKGCSKHKDNPSPASCLDCLEMKKTINGII